MGKIVGCLLMGAFGDVSAVQTSLIVGLSRAQIFYTALVLETRENTISAAVPDPFHATGLRQAWGP